MKSKLNVNMICGISLLIICAVVYLLIIPNFIVKGGGAQFMPRLSVVVTAIFSLWLFSIGLRERKLGVHDVEEAAMIDKMDLGSGESSKVVFLMIIWGAHMFLLPFTGFYAGSALAVAVSMILLGKRSLRGFLLWTVMAILFLYLVFEKLLQLRLPKGALMDKVLQVFFYGG